MSQKVDNYSQETIEKMKKEYEHVLVNAPPGALFRAKTKQAVITAYKSGKVLFQGNAPLEEAAKWTAEGDTGTKKAGGHPPKIMDRIDSDLYTKSHIGSDESGTGDYFGPITVAAVYIKQEQVETLKQLGIQDSKKITDANIKALAKEITKRAIPYSLLVLHNQKYNHLQQAGWSQGKMKAILHHHAIQNLLKKIGDTHYEGIVIDQFCTPPVYKNYLASEQLKLANKTFFQTKAESYSIAVATASIIARASFLNEMEKLSKQIGSSLLKGAGKQVDKLAAAIIQKEGETSLHNYAKVHFANTQKAKRYLENEKL